MHHQPDNKIFKKRKKEASKLRHPNTTTHTKPGKGCVGKNYNLVDLPRAVRQKDVNAMHIYIYEGATEI